MLLREAEGHADTRLYPHKLGPAVGSGKSRAPYRPNRPRPAHFGDSRLNRLQGTGHGIGRWVPPDTVNSHRNRLG